MLCSDPTCFDYFSSFHHASVNDFSSLCYDFCCDPPSCCLGTEGPAAVASSLCPFQTTGLVISQSRIGVKKCKCNKRTIKVFVSCF